MVGPDDTCVTFGAHVHTRAHTLKTDVFLSIKSMRTQGKMSVMSVTFSVTFGVTYGPQGTLRAPSKSGGF